MKMTDYLNLYTRDYIKSLEIINKILLLGISVLVVSNFTKKGRR